MQFPVRIAHKARLVQCRFATAGDVREVATWARVPQHGDPMLVHDAAEYAGLAADKWRFCNKVGRVACSIQDFQRAIQKDPVAEVATMLVVLAEWHRPKPYLGFCFFRRSWSHNLLIDLLGNSPSLLQGGTKIRGIATGLIYSVMAVGEALDAGSCWGEATDQSAGFYRKQFRKYEIQDQFNLTAAEQWHFMEKTRAEWRRTGLSLQLMVQ